MIENNKMPLDSYIIVHSEAKLSAVDKKEMIDYFKFIENDTRLLNDLPAAVEQSAINTK